MSKDAATRYVPITAVIQAADHLSFVGEVGLLNGSLIDGGIAKEFRAIIGSIQSWIRSAGGHGRGLESVVQFTAYVTNRKDAEVVKSAYKEAFGDSKRSPRIVLAQCLSFPGAHVEVDAVAYIAVGYDYEERGPR